MEAAQKKPHRKDFLSPEGLAEPGPNPEVKMDGAESGGWVAGIPGVKAVSRPAGGGRRAWGGEKENGAGAGGEFLFHTIFLALSVVCSKDNVNYGDRVWIVHNFVKDAGM